MNSILHHRSALAPIKTFVQPKHCQLTDVRAVVFDVYGTLVVSGSGDIGSADSNDHSSLMGRVVSEAGLADQLESLPTDQTLKSTISKMNASRIGDDCPSPEVDIVSVWQNVLANHGLPRAEQCIEQVVCLAATYESMANPTWPMPGAEEVLERLGSRGFDLGVVSNAQVFTPLLVQDLLILKKFEGSGFRHDLCFFSNRYRHSKPGDRLFQALLQNLQRRGILPQEALYVGNDMLNDVWSASQVGMKTAWFAGDERSLRPRGDDLRCRGLQPDLVLTSLTQLLDCLKLQ